MKTIQRLKNNEIVHCCGSFLQKDDSPIEPRDLYIGQRNVGPNLMIAKKVEETFIVPTCNGYCYNIHDCVKVKEVNEDMLL